MTQNLDERTLQSFGDEWAKFDQSKLSADELQGIFERYFAIFPWAELPERPTGFDLGCGSGRWDKLVAPRVEALHCIYIDASAFNRRESHYMPISSRWRSECPSESLNL